MSNNTQGIKKPDYASEEYKQYKDYNVMDIDKLDAFTRAYMECALWSSTDDEGVNLDDMHSLDNLAPETAARMVKDCESFQRQFKALLDEAYAFVASDEYFGDYRPSNAGHDFWLTRNHHGAGFWDRGLEAVGDALSKACEIYGNVDLYIGDDGMIYAT